MILLKNGRWYSRGRWVARVDDHAVVVVIHVGLIAKRDSVVRLMEETWNHRGIEGDWGYERICMA